MRPPQEVSSALLPYQNYAGRALLTHHTQGQTILFAWLQSSDSAAGGHEEGHNGAEKVPAGSDLIGQWRLDSAGSLLRLTFVESLTLPASMHLSANCRSTTLAAVFGEYPYLNDVNRRLSDTCQRAWCVKQDASHDRT